MFSVPPAAVIGDGDYKPSKGRNKTFFQIKEKLLGPDGKVKTERRGIFTSPNPSGGKGFSGMSKSTAQLTIGNIFKLMAYVLADPYNDAATIERRYQLE